jgi:hypothetical protein
LHSKTPGCTGMNATLTILFFFRKSNNAFSCTIFPVKKINVGKILKL